jgi:hypothetical protein
MIWLIPTPLAKARLAWLWRAQRLRLGTEITTNRPPLWRPARVLELSEYSLSFHVPPNSNCETSCCYGQHSYLEQKIFA